MVPRLGRHPLRLGFLFSIPVLMDVGIVIFAVAAFFAIVTLPVEFNASSRALNLLATAAEAEDEAPARRALGELYRDNGELAKSIQAYEQALSLIGEGEQVELQVEVQAKYAGYIDRQEREIAKHAKQESLRLPADIDYETVDGLSNEARQKLIAARPTTLGQASRLEGMTPSAVSLILVHLKKRQLQKSA